MSAANTGTKRRWIGAAIGATAAMALVLALFGVSRPPIPARAPPRARVAIEITERREKSALDDEATLLDPTPLFQPTHWSTAQLEVAPPEPGGTFQSYREPPHWIFAESDLTLGRSVAPPGVTAVGTAAGVGEVKARASLEFPDPVAVPTTPAGALASDLAGPILVGFGRTDEPVPVLAAHGALVDVVATGTGAPALAPPAMAQLQALAAGAKPPTGRPWQAMEFLAAVDAAGLVAPLTITARSGVEEVDAYFQNFLVRTLRIGERLAPGFYRISVGP